MAVESITTAHDLRATEKLQVQMVVNLKGGFAEDKGFALGPGGVGWKKVIFDNNKIDFNGATAQAMGEYYFYPIDGAPASKVEYTFGYKRNDEGKLRIYLHHSSLPYVPH